MNYVKVLGANGSKSRNKGTTCFQISNNTLIDAGNILSTLGNNSIEIEHIFLTHAHSDHITDLPFLLDNFYESRHKSLKIYASKETLDDIKTHLFNDKIWPDFQKINLFKQTTPSIEYIEIKPNEIITINNHSLMPFNANHCEGAYGYKVSRKDNKSYVISGDTYINDELTSILNNDENIAGLIIDCSFPNRLDAIAKSSYHLTPNLLKEQLNSIKNKNLNVYIYHLKHIYFDEIKDELISNKILENSNKILEDGDIIQFDTGKIEQELLTHIKYKRLLGINLELSSELNKDKLFEMIIELAMDLTNCEGGTLYTLSNDKKSLNFQVVQNKKLDLFMGGTNNKISWDSIPLFQEDGVENKSMVAAVCALENRLINIDDVYESNKYNFIGTKNFDAKTGYKSQSMVVIPLVNHEEDVIGVLQLLNKTTPSKEIISFDSNDEEVVIALASQAAMALTNSFLIDSIEKFLEAIVKTIAKAIDAKSKHTSHHIEKVAKIAEYIALAINKDKTIYKNTVYTKNDFEQIRLAALLHDIGKISMPEAIIDKSRKLEKLIDRIEIVQGRFDILKKDYEIKLLKNEITHAEYNEIIAQIDDDLAFVEKSNIGGEFMTEIEIQRIQDISKYKYTHKGKLKNILTDEEIYNLSIQKGTLTKEEKDIMNSHAQLSYEMLSELPFPKKYKDVMHIAVNHHEKLNGKGYPRGLTADEITLEDRIMVLADVFEALTSNDRPYKDAKKLSDVFKILSIMAINGEIDKDLLEFFSNSEELKKFASEELFNYQVDEFKLMF